MTDRPTPKEWTLVPLFREYQSGPYESPVYGGPTKVETDLDAEKGVKTLHVTVTMHLDSDHRVHLGDFVKFSPEVLDPGGFMERNRIEKVCVTSISSNDIGHTAVGSAWVKIAGEKP